MLLCLFRHGIAVDRADPSCPPDPERPLTDKGVRRTREAARGLRALGVEPAAVWTSPYLRARQTAEIAAKELGVAAKELHETDALLPEADPRALLAELAGTRHACVLCAGHLPHLELLLAQALVGRAMPLAELKKAGAALIELAEARRGRLLWLLEPSALRRLGR